MPYYIEAYLMQSPYFVTLAALKACTEQIVLESSGRFSQIWSHIIIRSPYTYRVPYSSGQKHYRTDRKYCISFL